MPSEFAAGVLLGQAPRTDPSSPAKVWRPRGDIVFVVATHDDEGPLSGANDPTSGHSWPALGDLMVTGSARLLLLRPVPPADGEEGPHAVPEPPYLLPSTRLDLAYCRGCPRSYEGRRDCAEAAPLVVAKARWAEAAGYDAMVVSCMLDPGVAAARKAVRMPVVGLGEANDAVAGLLGRRPARFYPIGIPVQQLGHDERATYCELARVARRCVERNAADVLIPNCAILGGLAWRLQDDLHVPVLPNEEVGVKLAELLVVLGLRPAHGHGRARLRARLRRVAAGICWRLRS